MSTYGERFVNGAPGEQLCMTLHTDSISSQFQFHDNVKCGHFFGRQNYMFDYRPHNRCINVFGHPLVANMGNQSVYTLCCICQCRTDSNNIYFISINRVPIMVQSGILSIYINYIKTRKRCYLYNVFKQIHKSMVGFAVKNMSTANPDRS